MKLWPTHVLASAALGGLAIAIEQTRRIREARRRAAPLIATARPFTREEADASVRVLAVGDSTGVGVGLRSNEPSVVELFAAHWPAAQVANRCVSGFAAADIARLLRMHASSDDRFDAVLMLFGGNDVIAGSAQHSFQMYVRDAFASAARLADTVIWMGSANVGLSPVLLAPCRPWLSARTRRLYRIVEAEAQLAGIHAVNLACPEVDSLVQADTKRYFARDGLHPTAEGHRLAYRFLRGRFFDQLPASGVALEFV